VLAWLPKFLSTDKQRALARVVIAAGGEEKVKVRYAPYDWGVNDGGKK